VLGGGSWGATTASVISRNCQTVLWALLFWQMLPKDRSAISPHTWLHIYDWDMNHYWSDSWFKPNLMVAQSLQLLDIVFSLAGLTKNNWFTVFLQIASRLFIMILVFPYV